LGRLIGRPRERKGKGVVDVVARVAKLKDWLNPWKVPFKFIFQMNSEEARS